MSAKTRKSGPSGLSAVPNTDRARGRSATRAIGDGDDDNDWAPPRAPSKPVLTICMDTRRQAGRRGARVSISAAAPGPKTAGTAGSVPRPPASVGPAPAAVEPAAPPARAARSCPWARLPSARNADAVPGVSKARAPPDPRPIAESARIGDSNPDDDHRVPGTKPRVDPQRNVGNDDNRRHPGAGYGDRDEHGRSAVRDRAAREVDTHGGDGGDSADEMRRRSPLRDDAQDRRDPDPRDDAKKADPVVQGEDRRAHADRRRREPGAGAKGPRLQWCRRDASLIAKTQERDRLTRRLIGALVGRPYGLTLGEVTTLAEEVLDRPCTMHDARLLVSELPRDMVVVRRMMTPWFVPRTAVALDTRVALDRVVAPAVLRALWQRGAGAGMDIRHLDVSVLTNTGTSLRVHSVNYANGSIRGLLGMLPGVVGRIEDIATRTVVYPAQHMRATALFAPLDDQAGDRAGAADAEHAKDEAHGETADAAGREQRQRDATTAAAEYDAPTGQGSAPTRNGACDAAVSRAARVTVVLVETVDDAAAACAHATEAAMASGAPVVVDARGLMAGRHARGPPIGLLQIGVPGGGPVYHLDMVGLHAAWFADPAHGHAVGSSELFAALGIAALLGDPRVVKAAFDSRLLVQMFWRRASCSVVNVFDLGRTLFPSLGHSYSYPYSCYSLLTPNRQCAFCVDSDLFVSPFPCACVRVVVCLRAVSLCVVIACGPLCARTSPPSAAHLAWEMRCAVAARALGAQVRNGWSENDLLAVVGMTIDADANELEAMSATDAWAWHRRPLAPRARAAAARQVVTLARAYQKVNPTPAVDQATDEATA
nr:Rho binding incomplete domain containing protein [Pandoravirus belohorizontensis]